MTTTNLSLPSELNEELKKLKKVDREATYAVIQDLLDFFKKKGGVR